jgi:hypothetical protein
LRRWLWTSIATCALASSMLVIACGDDDAAPATPKDGGDTPEGSGDIDGAKADSGDAGCTFAGYVTNLITTQTTSTALPATNLGESCTPSTSQDDFKPLFP